MILDRRDISVEEITFDTFLGKKSDGFLARFFGQLSSGELLETMPVRGDTPSHAILNLHAHIEKILEHSVEFRRGVK